MKTILLATVISLTTSSAVFAAADDAIDDLIYGSRGVTASQSQPAELIPLQKNKQQEDDLIYGYRAIAASSSEPPVFTGYQKNTQQEDDLIYGYRN
jgi:hypothetical protein